MAHELGGVVEHGQRLQAILTETSFKPVRQFHFTQSDLFDIMRVAIAIERLVVKFGELLTSLASVAEFSLDHSEFILDHEVDAIQSNDRLYDSIGNGNEVLWTIDRFSFISCTCVASRNTPHTHLVYLPKQALPRSVLSASDAMDLDDLDAVFLLGQALNLLDVGHSDQFRSLLVGELRLILTLFYRRCSTTIRLGIEVICTPMFRSQSLSLYFVELWYSLASLSSEDLGTVYQYRQASFVHWISNEFKFYSDVEKLRQWAVSLYNTAELLDNFGRNASSIFGQSFGPLVEHEWVAPIVALTLLHYCIKLNDFGNFTQVFCFVPMLLCRLSKCVNYSRYRQD